jgi:putative pyoverdin transport system ATP-binding/permease protein
VLIIRILRKENSIPTSRMAFMMCLAGGTNALILSTINSAAQHAGQDGPDLHLLIMFCLCLIVYILTQRYVMSQAMCEIERIVNDLRVRLIEKVRHSELARIERLVPSDVLTTIAKEPVAISNLAPSFVAAGQACLLLLFVTGYVAYLSLTALALTAMAAFFAVSIFLRRSEKLRQRLRQTAEQDAEVFEGLDDLLSGFKEVKMSRARGTALAQTVEHLSAEATGLKQETARSSAGEFVFAQSTFYLLLATVVFAVPAFSTVASADLVKITTAILFLIGPISMIVQAIPALATANSSMERLLALDEQLSGAAAPPAAIAAEADTRPPAVRPELRLEGTTFTYSENPGSEGFTVGPIDFVARPGEIVFITGGNGSGKTTLMKLMAGLYRPDSGRILLGGTPFLPATEAWIRDQISIIFSDFHLFRRLYGIGEQDPEKIAELLRYMQIDQKTAIRGDSFTNINLSTGQRKRLAMIVTLLEDKPVVIFDEWAADQDPAFRRKFYEEILPGLKAKGKVVICVTHDDRYFEVADHRFKMEFGRMVA